MNDNKNIFGEEINAKENNIFGETNNTIENNVFNHEKPKNENNINTVVAPQEQPIENFSNNFVNVTAPEQNIQKQAPVTTNEVPKNTEQNNENSDNEGTAGALIFEAILNAGAIFGIIYAYLNIKNIFIFIIPALIIILSIIYAIKDKKRTAYPQSVLVGGILAAICSFGLSIINQGQSDLYMYYTLASISYGILGMILSNVITTIIIDMKSLKALKTIGYFLLIGAYVAIPYYLYKTYPEKLYKYIFFEQIEVVAETEEEYILKTLKNRYGENFTCDQNKVKHAVDQKKQKISIRTCTSESGIETSVQSVEYEPSLVQYSIIENYLDERYFNKFKENLETKITQSTMATKVSISLYNEENCNLVADCVECEEYLQKKTELDDRKNIYETSVKLNFQKDLTTNEIDFVNKGKYKYIITINGNYAGYQEASYNELISKALNTLNTNNVQNNYGYEIIIKLSQSLGGNEIYNSEVYRVKGIASDDKTFKDPIVVE